MAIFQGGVIIQSLFIFNIISSFLMSLGVFMALEIKKPLEIYLVIDRFSVGQQWCRGANPPDFDN